MHQLRRIVDGSKQHHSLRITGKSMLLLVPLNISTARREDSPLGMSLPAHDVTKKESTQQSLMT